MDENYKKFFHHKEGCNDKVYCITFKCVNTYRQHHRFINVTPEY